MNETSERITVGHGVAFTVRSGGASGLVIQLTGQSPFAAYASAKDRFFFKADIARIDFIRNAAGRVIALERRQNGQVVTAGKQREQLWTNR